MSLQGDAVGSVQEVQFKQKSTNWKPQQQQQGKSKDRKWGEMRRNVANVGKHSITEMKGVLQKELPATTVTERDTGPEYVAAGQ